MLLLNLLGWTLTCALLVGLSWLLADMGRDKKQLAILAGVCFVMWAGGAWLCL